MHIKLKSIANASIFALVSLGSAIASTELLLSQQPAFARDSLGSCIQELRDRGISAQEAARICRERRDVDDNDDQYDDDDRYDDDRDERDNNYNIYNRDEWEGNRSRRGRGRYIVLRARSGPTPEGRWRYSAPGIPYDAMQRAGCENVRGDDWRCPTSRIRVQIRERWRYGDRDRNDRVRYIELRARSGPTPEGRWRYSAPGIPYDAMQRAGCENVRGDDWRCPTPRIRVQVTGRY